MKKALTLFAFAVLFSANAFATYVVVMKDGARYKAKAKWTVVNGKAIILLENGQSLTVDPSFIDVPKSEQLTKLGISGATIVDLTTNMPAAPNQPKAQPSLGSSIKLRTPAQQKDAQNPPTPAAQAPVSTGPGSLSPAVIDKFERAFDNMSIFERKIVSTGPRSLRAELTVDTEDRVFHAISATSFLMVKNAGVTGAQIDVVELFMKTTTGGAAGRFQMTRADAESLEARKLSQQEYFIRNVIY